mgnify:CR=1 FL=1
MDCRQCNARCCRYLATQIDKPTCKRDYDNIRWYLLHDRVHVFVDHEGDWYLEFETPCIELDQSAGLCRNYNGRPRICREHGDGEVSCEFSGGGEPHKVRFSDARSFESYLDSRGMDWRWKRP